MPRPSDRWLLVLVVDSRRVGIRAKLVALALALALPGAMAACGGDDPVKGSGYSYALPDEWVDRTDEAGEPALEIAGIRPDTLVRAERFEGFYTNVNVIREAGLPDGFTAGRYADISIASLRDPAASGFPQRSSTQSNSRTCRT